MSERSATLVWHGRAQPGCDQRTTVFGMTKFRLSAAYGLLALCVGGAALAQDAAKKEEPAKPAEQAAPAKEPAGDPLGDLDDLLGITKPATPQGAEKPEELPAGGVDRDKLELERRLTAQEVTDKFRTAVQQMKETADRLALARDAGLQTQRIQREIIENLDVLIKQAESQSQSSGQSSGQSRQSGQPQQQPAQPQQQRGQQNQAGEGENRGEATPPAFQDGQGNNAQDLRHAAWGSLPQRVRDALLQGSGDSFSSLYRSLTEEYYRKLAEEAAER